MWLYLAIAILSRLYCGCSKAGALSLLLLANSTNSNYGKSLNRRV